METDKNKLAIKVALQINKPVSRVFEAIVNPTEMSNYFISKSTGRMEEGKEIIWEFPEFSEGYPVRVNRIETDRFISFYWDDIDGRELLVEIGLEPRKGEKTLINITEKSREMDEAGIRWLKSNTEGWTNFLDCLKAYLEYGINLRKGGYDFMIKD
jgi:uncharacterized protein YndB with AHSA1/START domain